MKVFYHNDSDGKCAAAAIHFFYDVSNFLLTLDSDIEYIPVDYDIPFPMDKVKENEEVWIVDFSIPPDKMIELGKITKNIIWVDHHKTAIEKYSNFENDGGFPIEGLREEKNFAGCELTYLYLMMKINNKKQYGGPFKNGDAWVHQIPQHIRYVGDRDIWRWTFKEKTLYFTTGMMSYDLEPTGEFWNNAFGENFKDKIIAEGKIIEQYKKTWSKEYSDRYSFETEFGGYNCLCCNVGEMGSDFFGDRQKDYDVLLRYVIDGKSVSISLNTAKDNIDVSEIAKKFGGGGHKGAAGCTMTIYEFFLELGKI